MKFSKTILTLGALLLLSCQSAVTADKKQEGVALLSHASQLTNFEGGDSSPFRLRIKWATLSNRSGPVGGRYGLLWVSQDQWREEITFSDFAQVKIGGKDRVWTKRSLSFRPRPVGQVLTLVESLGTLSVKSDETVTKVFSRSQAGSTLRCVDLQNHNQNKRTLCFSASGELATLHPSGAEVSYQYSDYASFGSRSFPRKMVVVESKTPLIEAQVEELVNESGNISEMFRAPAGSVEQPSCANPTGGEVVQKVPPVYPPSVLQGQREGSVTMFVAIGTDGSVQNAAVIQTADLALDEAALAAVKQWRYKPTTCGAVPIPVETDITINFALQ